MDQDDEKISMLLGMGFPDVQAIKRALRLSNGDMNDAVTYLTENVLPSYNTVDDLRDVDMSDASTMGSAPPEYCNNSSGKQSNSLEFPATNLYELESRLFGESWVIPYKREESLGLCLIAATKLAEEGLCEADETCQRFLEKCLPECFQKLLNSLAVRRWGSDIQEGVLNMIDLLIDIIIARLRKGSLPEDLLRNSLSLVFDSETEWNQKNKHRTSEYIGEILYAEYNSKYECFGWLMDIINMFGNKGGFDLISKRLQEMEDLDAGQMTALFVPIAHCAKYMTKNIVSNLFHSSIEKAILYIVNLEEKDLKGKRIKYCYQLLEAVRTICEIFWPDEVQNILSIHLDLIIKMLKTPHFSARMVALKELGIIIGNSEKQSSSVIESDYIQDWMTNKAVLSLALEGNLDQVQYTDRMKQLVEFLGPKLKEEELTKIWNLCDKTSPHVVDNIHRIMIAAATRFNPRQFDHLLKLIRKSWEFGNDRLREKLLSLIGKIGQDSRYGRTTEKMLDVLWELARVPSLPPHLVHLAIDEHLRILNESVIREQLRKSYIIRCVEDIKRSPAVYLPLKQLHHLTKSVSRGSSSYSKSEKATLSELNTSLDIVCLITQSLSKSHELAVQTCKNEVPSPDTLIDGKYTHADYIFAHLDFLQFLLKEGDIYLAWPRCKEIWDTLVNNPKASLSDKETCFSWFSQCIDDLIPATQRSLFDERLLHLDSSTLSPSAFGCFVDYFRAINIAERKIVKARDKIVVESLEPLGLEFIWEIVLECLDQQLADDAISLLLDMAYMNLSTRLKRDPPQIHQKFISQCYSKLEKSLLHMNQSTVSNALSNAAKTLSAMAVSEISSLSPASKRSCLQHIFRILILVERYISTVEEQFSSPRVLLPHAACFFGKPVTIYVFFDGNNNNDVSLQCHSNEQMRSVYNKIAQSGSHTVDQLQQISFERLTQSSTIQASPSSSNQVDRHQVVHVSGTEHENKLLHQLCNFSNIKATVKVSSSCAQLKEVSSSSNWNELPDTSCYADNQEDSSTSSSVVTTNTNSQTASSSSCPSPSGSVLTQSAGVETPSPGESKLKEEKKLPGVVMAGLGKNVFNMLYQLSLLEDPKILDTVRRILYLIPTDPTIADKMDSICSSGSAGSVANSLSNFGGKTSQSNSPAKKEKNTNQAKKKETNLNVLKSLLEFEGSEITPFRLLYNVEVLSSKLIPVEGTMQFDSHFSDEFLSCGGLSILISLLHRESLPHDMDYEVRQSIYLIVLQLLRYMLCDKEDNNKSEDQDTPMSYHQYPQPPKRSAFDAYTLKKESLRHKGASLEVFYQRNMSSSSSSNLATKYLQNMPPEEWLEMVSSIMRVAWASAAGKLFLCSTGMASLDPSLNSPDSYKSSRENSTGSAHSSGSESERTFQGGICMQQSSLLPTDALIAIEALPLLITSLSLRADFIEKWYNLPSVKEFIIELLIGCSSWNVREKACQQFIRLTTVKTTNSPQPSQFLTQILHKARLPLWVSSTSARGATLKFVSQCSQYFDLISHLLSNLTQNSQDILNINASQMIEDEIVWMLNFTSTREATRERPESGIALLRNAENLLVAGHLKLISSLLSCENIDKMKCGEALIPLLIYEYLFPSSKLVLGPASNSFETLNKCSAKCTGIESRMTAYMLLAQVAVTSPNNFKTLSKNLTSLHHQLDRDSIKEFERCPVVEGRCPSGFVGLKNGGATCYMNSVLQQLFLVPGIQEDILSVNSDEECDDSLFFQLQNLFGHLLESQLQYYTPEKFWSCVSMGGQPINIREQQDAFEFYSRLSEQIDDYLKGRNLESVFSRRFEGLYSIQRICQDCPHRYEREEPFLALNLTVTKCSDLHDSLDQLVKGELLEGDNAYYCEKCSKKRTAVIRTCIKTLPQVLVIQLKRFGYDWEASRALKFDDYYKFPWTLDMGEYTVEALSSDEKLTSPSKGDRDSEGNFLSNMDPPSSIKTPKSTPKTPKSPNATPTVGGKSSKHSPLKLSMPSPAKFSMPRKLLRKRYELVGVIVHSGQANAGHYYSYIKDRRGDPISNPNKSKWFKFNDTTVEHVEMTNALLEQECFGGTYKAKVSYDSSNPMPEDRLRYWNAYMLFYDTIDDLSCTPKTPKTPRITGRTSRSLRASASSARKNLSLGGTTSDSKSVISSSDLATSPSSSRENNPEFVRAAQTSLCELSELLKRGEKQGMFRQQMPPRILATITHDNLTFLRDKDLYSMDYFNFIYNACFLALETFKQEKGGNSEMLVDAVSLGLKFLLNTYLRTRGKEVSVVQRWLELLTEILEKERMATSWCVHYFVSEGELHIQPLLLECPDKMVRVHFGNLLNTIITYECKQTQGTTSVEGMIKYLLSLLTSEVSAHVKTSEQYFTLLYNYCSQGSLQCEQMLKLGGFEALMQFLLGPSESNMRRWSPVHAQDFGPLHSIIAALILHSDASIKQMSKAEPLDEDYDNPIINTSQQHSCGLPSAVADVVYGLQRDQWLKEVVLAYREVVGGIPQLTEALKLLSREDSNFSFALIAAIMKQYGTAPSNLLKDLSILLLEILSLQDSLHSDRIGAVLSVFYSSQGAEIHGLLNLIEANKDSDSRRAYQCIKLIVYLAARSNVAREQLTDTQTNWQWAVEWLKSKMDSHPLGVSGVGGSNVSDLASGSNEDSSSRSFQRTTSAQWTLDEATALLSGMESIDMEIEPEGDEDEELADIKESPENDNNPSVGEFTSDS